MTIQHEIRLINLAKRYFYTIAHTKLYNGSVKIKGGGDIAGSPFKAISNPLTTNGTVLSCTKGNTGIEEFTDNLSF